MMHVEPRRFLAPPLPSLRTRHGSAWAVALGAHVVVLALGLWLLERTINAPPPEPERMIYIEPAPPPPPPLGAPASAPRVPLEPKPVVERPKEVPKPHRLIVPHKQKRVAPPPTPVALPQGAAEGSAGGVTGGVVGGEAGGKLGGVVGGHGDAPLPANAVEHPPVLISRVLPVYPPMARARGLQGRVVLRAVIDRNGRVEEGITFVESQPMFDTAAVDALRRWRFEPGRDHDGKTVRVLVEVPIRFQLR
jgi:protein TonB